VTASDSALGALWRRAWTAARWGTHCGRCGCPLDAGAAVWLDPIRLDGRLVACAPICATCAQPMGRYDLRRWPSPLPCEGCGRPVHYGGGRRYRVRCSTRCAWTVANRRRSQAAAAAAAARRTACTVCGTVFEPSRADRCYCSPACKQRAYRQRHGLVTDP